MEVLKLKFNLETHERLLFKPSGLNLVKQRRDSYLVGLAS